MGIPTAPPTFTTRSFQALVREADPDYDRERLTPVVYWFGQFRTFRDAKVKYQVGTGT